MSHDQKNVDLDELGPVVELCTLDSTPPPVDFNFCDLERPKPATTYVSSPRVESGVQHYWQPGGPSV